MDNMSKINPYFDAVIGIPVEDHKTKKGLIKPNLEDKKTTLMKVIAVGPGKTTVTGTFIPTTVSTDELVVIPSHGFSKFKYKGTEYLVGKENEIIAKIEDDNE